MKKLLIMMTTLVLTFSLVACAVSDNGKDNTDNSDPSGVQVDEGVLNVTVTLPPSWFEGEDMQTFDPEAYVKENGFKKAVVNDDESITVTMSKSKHKALLTEMKKSVDENLASLVNSEETPYIKEIKSEKDFKKVTVKVDKTGYDSALLDMTPFLIAMSASLYQTIEGTTPTCEIVIQDAVTGDVMNTIKFPDALTTEGQ